MNYDLKMFKFDNKNLLNLTSLIYPILFHPNPQFDNAKVILEPLLSSMAATLVPK